MSFDFRPTAALSDVITIRPRVFADHRGWFMETYQRSAFTAHGISAEFVQCNHSRSEKRGVLRGLHYQLEPMAQGKLVRCVTGAVFDVAVDIRRGSPTFGSWAGVELTADNHVMLWIPAGFAHGFCTLRDGCDVLYDATAEYSAEHDRAIRWDDPALAITWPVTDPILSAKDRNAPALDGADNNLSWTGTPAQ
jgi:dTDP-4-dehydrorhamnose 3,5-epimerase